MATTIAAHPQTRAAVPRWAVRMILIGTIISTALGKLGGSWDIAYHRTYVVDTFFSPPHIVIYSGMTTMLALGIVVLAIVGWSARTHGGLIAALTEQPMLVLPLIANLGFLVTGPFDDLWHRIYGRDKLTIWSPPHMVLLFNMILNAISGIGLALWLRSATPTAALAPSDDRRTHRWTAWCIGISLTLTMSYLWAIPAGWEAGAQDDITVTRTISWLYPLFVYIIIAFGITCAAWLLPARWWLPALTIGLSTYLWWTIPDVVLQQAGYLPSGEPPIILPIASLVYVLIRATRWPRAAQSIAAALSIATLLLVVQAAGKLNYVSPLDILLTLPVGPLAIALGERMGTGLAHLLLRSAGRPH